MSWPKEFENYHRMPIAISAHVIMLLQIFRRTDHLADAWTWDAESVEEWAHLRYQLAAEQFHKQLEGCDCIAFWQALRDEADKEIKAWEKRCSEKAA